MGQKKWLNKKEWKHILLSVQVIKKVLKDNLHSFFCHNEFEQMLQTIHLLKTSAWNPVILINSKSTSLGLFYT